MKLANVLVMLAITVIAVLAFIALQKDDAPGGGMPATMPAFVKGAVTKIVATDEGRPLVVRRRTDRSDAWEVEVGTTSVRADANAIDDLLSELGRQDVRHRFRYVEDKLSEADIKGYGLDAPPTTIELTVPEKTILVRYGKKSREGTSTYMDTGPGTDVWVVGGGIVESLKALGTTGARSSKLTDLRQFDVGAVEIAKGGVTLLQAERDTSQVWKVTQPFKGFADKSAFEKLLSKLTNIDVSWVDIDTKDLRSRGLDPAFAEVTLAPKRGGDPSVVLIGSAAGDGVHVLEKGRNNVGVTPRRVLDAILEVEADPNVIRDRSFTRIGVDGNAIGVKLGALTYRLSKEGASWDVREPEAFPGDDTAIRELMTKIKSWKTLEFDDRARPEEKGIREGGDSVEIKIGDATTMLLIGAQADATSWWAQRRSPEGDSGVERVDGDVIQVLLQGYPQFRLKKVRDFSQWWGDLQRIAREPGKSDEGATVEAVVLRQDSANGKPWAFADEGPPVMGTLDNGTLSRLLDALRTVTTKQWLMWNPNTSDKEMGTDDPHPYGQTLSITLKFSGASGTPPGSHGENEQILFVGKKAPGGGYYARFGDRNGGSWAFVMSETDVEALKASLSRK